MLTSPAQVSFARAAGKPTAGSSPFLGIYCADQESRCFSQGPHSRLKKEEIQHEQVPAVSCNADFSTQCF